MAYQSIIRLLEYCNIGSNTDTGKIKKIVSAEFLLTANKGIISIDGFDYTKNDVIEEIERSDFLVRLKYHRTIYETPGLLDCLEKNKVDIKKIKHWKHLAKNRQFISFLSPIYAESFDNIMRKFLNPSVSFKKAGRWMETLYLIDNATDEDRAMQSVRLFITEFIRKLKNVNTTTYKTITRDLNCWIQQPSYLLVNLLPASLYKLKDELVGALINFTVLIYPVNKKGICLLSDAMTKFSADNMNPELKALINNNQIAFRNGYNKKGCAIIVYTLVAIFFIFCWIMSAYQKSNRKEPAYKPGYNFLTYKSVTPKEYEILRASWEFLRADSLSKTINQEITLWKIKNNAHKIWPCYLIFELADSARKLDVEIINRTHFNMDVYMKTANEEVIGIRIDKSNFLDPPNILRVQRNKHTLDMLIKLEHSTLNPVPIYVSDADFRSHTIPLMPSEGIINTGSLTGYDKNNIIRVYLNSYVLADTTNIITVKISNANYATYR